MDLKQAKELVRSRLSDKRYEHTINVKKMAVKLAKHYGTDPEQAALAALLHDAAKELPKDEMRAIMQAYPEYAQGGEARPTPVWHGICAAILARTEWGVTDEAVLSAIACHTAGKAGMTQLDKILYLADMTSAERDWPGVEKLRKLEMKDLDAAMLAALRQTNGFVLSEGAFAVTVNEDGAVIEVEIKNTLIRGTVQITNVDKDYPDNKLTGAEFFVYRDSNGNKALDADDELLGTLTETSVGVYEMSDLVYGGYFVKEQKAPEGFYLDENAYYFEITENGKTVTVENEAGKGFVNTAKVGSLKIIKTSSDGKIEGFSFRVTGPNGYSEVFTTDKNGEILIENLRIGDYTVSEVSDGASVAYILPADKTASVFEGAVTKVEMHNELRDTPKTGDDSNPALWKWLTAIGMLGFAACGGGYIAYAMKKKKEDAE